VGALQKPAASNVAGVRTWNSLGRFVRRGEKGILILPPRVGRKHKNLDETTGQNGEEKTVPLSCTSSAPSTSSKGYLVICGRDFARPLDAASATLESPLVAAAI
jgi:hypothetical protein